MQQTTSLFEELFVFSMLGDDRTIRQTWSMGQPEFMNDKFEK